MRAESPVARGEVVSLGVAVRHECAHELVLGAGRQRRRARLVQPPPARHLRRRVPDVRQHLYTNTTSYPRLVIQHTSHQRRITQHING